MGHRVKPQTRHRKHADASEQLSVKNFSAIEFCKPAENKSTTDMITLLVENRDWRFAFAACFAKATRCREKNKTERDLPSTKRAQSRSAAAANHPCALAF